MKYENLGIQVHLEDQDLPLDVSEYPVSVSVAISGDFELPEKSELVSGVYKISSSFVPQKPITIKMEHCATDNCIDNLSFAASNDIAHPFVFKYIGGGKFTSTYGEIEVDEFCYYTILEKHGREGLLSLYQKRYQVSLHCTKNPTMKKSSYLLWNLFFIMVKNCTIFQRSIDKYFVDSNSEVERLTDVVVKFNKDSQAVTLGFEGDSVEIQRGWSIIKVVACCIQKNEVNNYVDGRPPLFNLFLK